ncbi:MULTISPECIES: hypothetical protein [unclassified Nocardioides]|uniref:hypothetical protein n=1 Tax=unclassified Nocardioides TaxID=2615069 RepID=UPI00005712B0|nr:MULTISPECIES: hypothetical protein [unclassified Nocardioides]ABL83144.1 hypothetical protein Noca_3644 [Nocardioides sp. JS614]
MRPLTLLGAVVATLLALLVPVSPATAATTYTWTGAESNAWGNKKNWNPEGVPQNGDSVQLGPGPRPTITDVPDVQLAMLTVNGSTDGLVSMSGPGQVITGSLQWNGGDINVDLMVSAPPLDPTPSFIMMGQTPMHFGNGDSNLADHQTLTINSTLSLMTGLAATDDAWLTFMFDSSMRIASTGKLLVDPAARVLGSRCCSGSTSTVIVDGTLEVFSAIGATGYTARFDELGFDLAGDLVVPKGNTLEITGGPIRVGGHAVNGTVGDASIKGGGIVDINETDGDAWDEAHPLLPDGTMKFIEDGEKLTLADDTALRLGPYSEVSGVGSIEGKGSVTLAGTTVRGRLTIADGVPATTEAGTQTTVAVWDRDLPGQTGWLTPAGGLKVAPTSSVRVLGGGGRLIVPKDATLEVPAGATIDAGGCCSDTGRVTLQKGSTMKIGAGEGDPAMLTWIELGGQGTVEHAGSSTWDLAGTTFTSGARITGEGTITGDLPAGPADIRPSGILTVDGDLTTNQAGVYRPLMATLRSEPKAAGRLVVTGTAALSGRLQPIGDTTYAVGRRIVVLEAGSITGGYQCAVAGGMLLDPAATNIGLRAIEARVSDCLKPAPASVLSAAFSGSRRIDLGLPDSAQSVLLDVTVSGATRGTTLKLSAGRGTVSLQVPRRRTVTRWLEVPVAAHTRLTVQLAKRARVKINQVGYAF